MKKRLFILLLAPALLFACAPTQESGPVSPAAGAPSEPAAITNKYWKLATLKGQPVRMVPGQKREVFFALRAKSRLVGFGGCNIIEGHYKLQTGNRIHFAPMAATRRACPGLERDEAAFLKVFELANHYSLHGDTLRLNGDHQAPLAVFHAVYF